jgi:hypothetical protein
MDWPLCPNVIVAEVTWRFENGVVLWQTALKC